MMGAEACRKGATEVLNPSALGKYDLHQALSQEVRQQRMYCPAQGNRGKRTGIRCVHRIIRYPYFPCSEDSEQRSLQHAETKRDENELQKDHDQF